MFESGEFAVGGDETFWVVGCRDATVGDEVLRYLQNQSTRCKRLTQMGCEFAGLSIFNPFSDENAFQMDTKTRFGSEFLPANSHPI